MEQIERPILAYISRAVADSGTSVVVTPQTGLLASGVLDSIGLVGLIQFIETEFSVEIPDSDLNPELFESPATLAAYVARRLA